MQSCVDKWRHLIVQNKACYRSMHFHPYIYAVLIWRSSWDNSQTDHRQVTSLCHSSVEKWVDCWDVILSYPIQRWKNSVYRYRARAIQGTNIYRDSTTQTHKTATTNQAGIFSCSFQFLLSAAQILLKIWKTIPKWELVKTIHLQRHGHCGCIQQWILQSIIADIGNTTTIHLNDVAVSLWMWYLKVWKLSQFD